MGIFRTLSLAVKGNVRLTKVFPKLNLTRATLTHDDVRSVVLPRSLYTYDCHNMCLYLGWRDPAVGFE